MGIRGVLYISKGHWSESECNTTIGVQTASLFISIYLSIYLSICFSVHLYVCMYVCMYVSIYLFLCSYLSIYLFTCKYECMYISDVVFFLSIYLSRYQYIYIYIYRERESIRTYTICKALHWLIKKRKYFWYTVTLKSIFSQNGK